MLASSRHCAIAPICARIHSRTPSSGASAAFTLTETLTAIAIIAVLATVLTLSLGQMRKKARDTQCMSNLRQLGMACVSYSADHGGNLPFGYTASPKEAWTGATTPFWFVDIAPYAGAKVLTPARGELHTPGIFACPEDKVPWVSGSPNQFRPSCSYAFPIALAAARLRPTLPNPLRLPMLSEQSRTVMLVDSVFGNVFNPPQLNSNGTASNDPDEPMSQLYQRHHGINVVFLDGHCAFIRAPIPTQAPAHNPYLWGPVLAGPNANL